MPLITDWLMFGITAVYVIATIFICKANIKAANASRDQIAESQRQFDESKRLECMPFLQMQISCDDNPPEFKIDLPMCDENAVQTISKVVKLKNVGNGTATTITYDWRCDAVSDVHCEYPPFNAIMQGDASYIILCCDVNHAINEEECPVLTLYYEDLLGHSYKQQIILHFNWDTLMWCENDNPKCET